MQNKQQNERAYIKSGKNQHPPEQTILNETRYKDAHLSPWCLGNKSYVTRWLLCTAILNPKYFMINLHMFNFFDVYIY